MSDDSQRNISPESLAELEKLELPSMTPIGLMRHFGPGMILMMTGIGTSHLLTAPVAGGRFEYALLWCIPVAYIFKYYGFEMAFRFTHATGRSMLDAYGTAWMKWPLWYVLITTLIQCTIGQAGRLVAASAVLYYLFFYFLEINLPLYIYGAVLGAFSVFLLLRGRYATLELVTKIASGLLFVTVIVVYFVRPAPLASFEHFFIIETPEDSWLIIAAFLGLLPTGIDVSLQASEWGKAKKVGTGRIRSQLEEIGLASTFDPFASKKEDLTVDMAALPPHAREYSRRWFRISMWDFRLGHVVSFVMACIFLLLAAVWLFPSEVSKKTVMGQIAGIFTESVGPWMMIVFLAGAFAATFSTAFNYFDGWPRVIAACCRNMFRRTAGLSGIAREDLTAQHTRSWYSEYNIYRGAMFFSLFAAVAIISLELEPVYVVLVASALALFIAPVVFFLNLYYCLTVIPKTDKSFYPSTFAIGFSWLSLIIFTGLTAIVVMARVFKVELFGG